MFDQFVLIFQGINGDRYFYNKFFATDHLFDKM